MHRTPRPTARWRRLLAAALAAVLAVALPSLAAGDSLVGTFVQGPQAMPFRLARSGPPQLAAGPAPEELLEGFDADVEETMEAFHVPGASVAIVHDGEVVLARGYGVRSRESGAAVTDSTSSPSGP